MPNAMTFKTKHAIAAVLLLVLIGIIYIATTRNSTKGTYLEVYEQKPVGSVNTNTGVGPVLKPMKDVELVKPEKEGIDMSQWWQGAALINWWFMSPMDYGCRNIAPMGNYFVCQTPPFTVKKPCLIYSFGIAHDFSFDGKMGSRVGCEVHSFDPSMMRGDFQYSKEVTFHNMALGDKDDDAMNARRDIYVKEKQLWKMRTLKSIMKELGHENRLIDVVKMDIEGHEWAVVKNMLDDGVMSRVKQFCLEWHLFSDWPPKSSYFQFFGLLQRLKNNGIKAYKKTYRSHIFDAGSFNIQGEMYFVNTNFKAT